MHASFARRILIVVTTLGLVAASSVAISGTAQATPAGEPADSRPLPDALTDAASERNEGLDKPKQQVPAFTVAAEQQVHGRAGGKALVNVNLSRRKAPGVNASNLKVLISGPTGYRVISAAEYTPLHGTDDQVADWTCVVVNAGKDQECSYSATGGALASGVTPDPIRAVIAIADTVTPGSARIESKATWTEDKVAEGQTGESTDTVVGTRNQEQTDGVELAVDSKLTVALEGGTGDVIHIPAAGGTDAQRTGNLIAKIGHIDGRDAKATWSQTSSDPTVTFVGSTTVDQPADSASSKYVVPAGTPDGARLTFRIDVESNGHLVSDTKSVTVRTHEPGVGIDARGDTLRDLAAATTQRPNATRQGLKIDRGKYRAAIAGKGVKHVTVTPKASKKLKSTSLKFKHPTAIKSVKWSIVAGPKSLLKKSTKKRSSITIRIPKRKGTWLIRGSATLNDGKKVSRTKVLKVDPVRHVKKTKKRTFATRALDLRVAAADAPSTESFCKIVRNDKLNFADGSTLTLPSNYKAPANCTSKSSQTFSGATFSYDGTTLGSASGTLSGSTVRLGSVVFALPTKLASALPAGVPTSFTISPPAATLVTATQTNGTWGAWTGTFSVPYLSFLPVPADWSEPTGKLTLEPTISSGKVTGAELSLTQESATSDGSGGSVSFDLTFSTAGPSDIKVTAANIAVFQSGGGDQIEFSGVGTFYLGQGQSNTMSLSMNCTAPDASGDCPLASGFSLAKGTTLTWKQGSGVSLSGAKATVGSGTSTYTFSLSGTYTAAGNWSLSVAESGSPWSIGSTGVTLSDFAGTVSETPTSGGLSEFAVAITGTVNDLNVGSELALTSAEANITNKCDSDSTDCTPGDVNVLIDVDATANILGDSVAFNATASLNLTTLTFEFDTSETVNVDFGPEALNITSATLTLTNQTTTGSCVPAGGGQGTPSSGMLSLGLSASGTAYGQPITIAGDINSDGYCLWGALGDYTAGVFSGNDIVLAFSSYTAGADLTLPANAGDTTANSPSNSTMSVNVPAGTFKLTGGINIPANATDALGLPAGQATFTATADGDLSSMIADATYQLTDPVFIGGGASTNGVGVTINSVQVKVGLTSSPMEATLSLDVAGDVVVASNGAECGATDPGGAGECSYTDVGGSIGITLSGSQVSVNIQLGVNGATNNAFGQAGLAVNDLAISASAGVPGGISLAVNADATLPTSWTSDVALINNAPVSLAFNISETSPCVAFSIGEEDSGTTYLDIANAGVVTASYVNLVIAPRGCTVPVGSSGSKTIPAGYSFAFDGNVLGDATTVALSVSFDPTIIDATLDLTGFDLLGVVEMDNTNIELAMNSGTNSFSLGFSGGFGLGDPSIAGGTVNVNGDVIKTSGGNFTLVLGGNGSVNLADVIDASITSGGNNCPSWTSSLPQPPNNCLVAIQEVNGQIVNSDISANISFGLLGAQLFGDVDLVYTDGTLQDFHLGLGASIDFWVGSVQGTAYIDYCQGILSPNSDGTTGGQSCLIQGSEGTFRVFFNGSYELGPCGDHWYDDACWTDGFSDTVVDTSFSTLTLSGKQVKGASRARAQQQVAAAQPKLDVDFGLDSPGGKTTFGHPANASDYSVNLLWNHANVIGWTGTSNGTGGYDLSNSVALAAVAPSSFQGSPACADPASGISWSPSSGNHNPAPAPPVPVAAACALEVVYMTPGANVVSEFGGTGTTVPADRFADFSAWATTNAQETTLQTPGANWFNAAQRGHAVCTPRGSDQDDCVLYDDNGVTVGTILSGATSGTAPSTARASQAHVQLLNGLDGPMGSVPAGTRIANGSSVWSADGRQRLQVVDGVATLYDGGVSGPRYPADSGAGLTARWSVGSTHVGGYLELGSDGVAHLRDSNGASYWSSGSPSTPVSGSPFMVIGGDYGLSITDDSHLTTPLWHW